MIAWLKRSLGTSPVESRGDLALGIAAYRSGDLQRACQILETTVHEHARSAPALKALGDVYSDLNRTAEAIHCYERALAINPHYAEALNNLGLLSRHSGDFPAAENMFRRALAARPDLEAAKINLADAIEAQGDFQGAIDCLEEVLRVKPASVQARNNLGVAYASLGNWTQAEKHYRISLEHEPQGARIWSNLSLALRTQARTAEALDAGLRAIQCDPRDSASRSQYLLTTNYSDLLSADAICAAHLEHGGKLEMQSHWSPAPRPLETRKLRIGYVSADFGFHVVSFFMEPVLREHDRSRCEIFCYHNAIEDAQTQRLKAMGSHWRSIHGRDDASVVDLMRADQLDVAVDLSGHTGGNRLAVFAQRVALVQATWLGYPNTTGLQAMDIRITDADADPVGMTEHLHSEKLVRLPRGFICYQPRPEAPAVSELPALRNGHVTFGCFNNPAKLTDYAMRVWATLLSELPTSRLLLKGNGLDETSFARRVRDRFAAAGGDSARLELRGDIRGFEDHLRAYGDVDVALDSFPYCGTTTTFEALWMGCPVVTLAGDRHAARVGASILNRLDQSGWVADTAQQYVQAALALADDIASLASIRTQLRDRLTASTLVDAATFTRTLEKTLREVSRDARHAK